MGNDVEHYHSRARLCWGPKGKWDKHKSVGPLEMWPKVLSELTKVSAQLLSSLRGHSEQGRFLII